MSFIVSYQNDLQDDKSDHCIIDIECQGLAKRLQHFNATSCNINLLHDVATCVEWTGQTHATYRNTVAKRTQHVVPNNVTRCCVEMLRAFG